jgi:hypothetical protein
MKTLPRPKCVIVAVLAAQSVVFSGCSATHVVTIPRPSEIKAGTEIFVTESGQRVKSQLLFADSTHVYIRLLEEPVRNCRRVRGSVS